MKKSKILIPTLSVASMGAVIAPMVTMTSCTSTQGVLSVNDINYRGEIHELVEAGDGAWTDAKATEEYYKTNRHLAEDTMTILVPYFIADLIDELMDHKNIKYNFNFTINELNIGSAKEVKVSETQTIKGYMVSGRFTGVFNASYNLSNQELSKHSELLDRYEETKQIIDISFSNCFSFLQYSNTYGWVVGLGGVKNASDDWQISWSINEHFKRIDTFNYDGSKVQTEGDEQIRNVVYGAKYGDKDTSVFESENIPSNYLSKVAHKTEA